MILNVVMLGIAVNIFGSLELITHPKDEILNISRIINKLCRLYLNPNENNYEKTSKKKKNKF